MLCVESVTNFGLRLLAVFSLLSVAGTACSDSESTSEGAGATPATEPGTSEPGAVGAEPGASATDPEGPAPELPPTPVTVEPMQEVPVNEDGCSGSLPAACPGRGVFDEAQTVELTTDDPSLEIFYTLDGSQPSRDNGTLYSAPFEVGDDAAVVVLRATALAAGAVDGAVETHSYVFPRRTVEQPAAPEGMPEAWGPDLQPADYEMDPDVLASPELVEQAIDALHALPSLSIVMEHDDLWGTERGIHMNPAGDGIDWERPASAELLFSSRDESPELGFQIGCGIRMTGGASRRNWASFKLSMRLLFKEIYGAAKLDYPMFAESPVASFDTLILDAHSNNTWTHHSITHQQRAQLTLDQFVADLQRSLGGPGYHARYAHLYLNGLYWGLYELHERPDDAYAASYHGGGKSEYDLFKHRGPEPKEGDSAAWVHLFDNLIDDAATPETYEQIELMVDIPLFIDYMLINFYGGNTDWPLRNWYGARRRCVDETDFSCGFKFRFYSWDAENVLRLLDMDVTNVGTVTHVNTPGELFRKLQENPDFRIAVAQRVQAITAPGQPLYVNPDSPGYDPALPENNRPAALYMQRFEQIQDALLAESARWGDSRQPDAPYTVDDYVLQVQETLTHLEQRTNVFVSQF